MWPRPMRGGCARGFGPLDVQQMLNRFRWLVLLLLLSGPAATGFALQATPAQTDTAPVPEAAPPSAPTPQPGPQSAPQPAPQAEPAPSAAPPPATLPSKGETPPPAVHETQPPAAATPAPKHSWFRLHRHRGQQPWVAAANPLAVDAGLEILRRGGKAVDAAVAVQTMLGLVEPQSSGVAGGSFLLYYDAHTGKLTAFDGREKAPAGAHADMFLDENRKPMSYVEAVRSGAIKIDDACRRYSLSLEEFAAWEQAIQSHGVPGLRVTRLQIYRDTEPARSVAPRY